MIECFWANTRSLTEDAYRKGIKKMPSCIGSRIIKLKNEDDRKASLAGKLVLHSMLIKDDAAYLMDFWQFGEYDKPFIPGWRHFNISHSGEIVVVVVGDYPLGVDIEKIELRNDLGVAEYFHSGERRSIYNSETPVTDFYRIWTRKEAFLKATGLGLNMDLKSFNCLHNRVTWMGSTWSIGDVNIHPEYRSAICCKFEELIIKSRHFEFFL